MRAEIETFEPRAPRKRASRLITLPCGVVWRDGGNEGGNPFFQMAVEMALLEGSRVFVATERSNLCYARTDEEEMARRTSAESSGSEHAALEDAALEDGALEVLAAGGSRRAG